MCHKLSKSCGCSVTMVTDISSITPVMMTHCGVYYPDLYYYLMYSYLLIFKTRFVYSLFNVYQKRVFGSECLGELRLYDVYYILGLIVAYCTYYGMCVADITTIYAREGYYN
jgi:hypothetical protein